KGFFKCFGCGASGDVFKFVQQIENLSFPEAKRQLGERYGVVIRGSGKEFTPEQQAIYAERDRLVRITAAATAWFREQFAGNAGHSARDYARKRELSQSTLEKFGIGYAPDSWDALRQYLVNKYGYKAEDCVSAGLLIEKEVENGPSRFYDRYRHRLMFPIWDERGQVIAFGGRALDGGQNGTPEAKYINSPEGPLFKKSRTLYGWHLARAEAGKRESIIVTEGYMDAIALHAGGFPNTIATLGTALTTQHVVMLKRLAPKTVYLCFDGDSAGMRAALRAAPLFDVNGLNVRVVALPKEDDPDTFIAKHGEVGFRHALENARLLAQYRVEMALDGFDFSNIGERAEAIQAASEVISTVQNATEKEEYISWLAGRWAREEGVTAAERMHMIEAAVRRQVASVGKKEANGRPAGEAVRAPWTPKDNPNWKRNAEPPVPSANRDEEQAGTDQTLVRSASGQLSGAARAERLLLSAMLNSPSWRNRILEQMPASQWTQELHYEIASALRPIPEGESINPTLLLETISSEAGGLASELMLSDQSQTPATPEVITDCIRRVEGHWARQREREILDLVKGKLERGEAVTLEERAAYTQALIDTKRKTPIEAEAT
ncbi:MAG: primase, partial [Abditibacteriota bacterium]|nr:primase [Abditibacteriota bacterium]